MGEAVGFLDDDGLRQPASKTATAVTVIPTMVVLLILNSPAGPKTEDSRRNSTRFLSNSNLIYAGEAVDVC